MGMMLGMAWEERRWMTLRNYCWERSPEMAVLHSFMM
jgi:hypothetical protein